MKKVEISAFNLIIICILIAGMMYLYGENVKLRQQNDVAPTSTVARSELMDRLQTLPTVQPVTTKATEIKTTPIVVNIEQNIEMPEINGTPYPTHTPYPTYTPRPTNPLEFSLSAEEETPEPKTITPIITVVVITDNTQPVTKLAPTPYWIARQDENGKPIVRMSEGTGLTTTDVQNMIFNLLGSLGLLELLQTVIKTLIIIIVALFIFNLFFGGKTN